MPSTLDKTSSEHENESNTPSFEKYMQSITNPDIIQYVEQMNQLEKNTLKIAYEHLESSFDIEKSIGFKNYQSK